MGYCSNFWLFFLGFVYMNYVFWYARDIVTRHKHVVGNIGARNVKKHPK